MTQKAKSILVGLAGLLAGAALTVNLSAIADKDAETALPVEELRAFTDVFARIKNDYVEPVEDKKLITEAINGMLTGLDPHSSYLDIEAFKDLQVGKDAPYDIDYVGLIALRQDYGFLNYLNLFVHLQTRTGRAQELYQKWVGGTMPDLTVKGIYR